MTKYLAAFLACVCLGLGAAQITSASSSSSDPRVTSLQHQVASLTKRLNSYDGRIRQAQATASSAQETAGGVATDVTKLKTAAATLANLLGCTFAISWDGIHFSWRAINIITEGLGAGDLIQPWSPLDDQGTCAALGVNRTPQATSALPSPLAVESALRKLR